MLQPTLDLGQLDSPLLVFGGPYSNLPASQALLLEAERLKLQPQQLICTGDVVAYCAQAEQTCRLFMDAGIHVVMGNCEESLANQSDDCGCGFEPGMVCSTLSQKWYRYADQKITSTIRQWMTSLPRAICFNLGGFSFRVIHGGVEQINRFIFASSDRAIKQQELNLVQRDVIIGGHCGLPFGQRINHGAWLNAGVIGLPANDGTRSGWYMLLIPQKNGVTVSWHRLEYDAESAQRAMIAEELDDYAYSLINGLWPSMDILPQAEKTQQGRPLSPKPLNLVR